MPDIALSGERLIASVANSRAPFLVGFTAIQANSTAGTSGAEAVWVTTPVLTFPVGRAFEVTIKGLISPTTTGSEGQLRVRKTGLGGQFLLDSFRFPTPLVGNYGFYFSATFANFTGAAITAALAGTVGRSNGTADYSVSASSANPAYIRVTDVGPATDFTGVIALT
ncbi:hypothetical protein ACWCPT_05705 [Streptomyces sp. NPDC002308]